MKIVGDVFDSNHYTKGLTARQRLIFQLCKTDEHISIDLRFNNTSHYKLLIKTRAV